MALFKTKSQAWGALTMLEALMRYFTKYADRSFSGVEVLNVLDWYRDNQVPRTARAKFDDQMREGK